MTTNSGIVIPSSPADRQAIKNALQEISNSLTRIEGERDLIKDILQTVQDNQNIPKKYVRKLAKIFHKQNYTEVQQEQEDIDSLYETVAQ
jgi:polyhydroxyalkanoate synthesis regulator phasin